MLSGGRSSPSHLLYEDTTQARLIHLWSFQNGSKDGEWLRWSEDGDQLAEANYEDGHKDGPWKIWDENGVLRYDMTYEMDQKVNIWYMYDAESNLVSERNYNE